MKNLFFLLLSLLISSCSSSNNNEMPEDFRLSYFTKSGLLNYELKIQITDDKLILNYKNGSKSITESKSYTIKESESEKLFNFARKNNLMKMKVDNSTFRADSPLQNISVSYGNNSNSIDFGNVEYPPASLTQLKEQIFNLTSKYNTNWKSDLEN